MRGACCDATFLPGRPSVSRLRALGMTGVRLVAKNQPAFYAYHRALERAVIKTAVVLTGESFETEYLGAQAADYAWQIQPAVWLIGNEWNVDNDASWPVGTIQFVDTWHQIAGPLRIRQPNAKLYVGGLYSEANLVSHLRHVVARLDPQPDGVDIHPYLDTPEAVAKMCGVIRDMGLEVGIFEWNWAEPDQIAGFETILDRVTDHSMWIPFATEQIPDMAGLVKGGRLTACGRSYRDALRDGA